MWWKWFEATQKGKLPKLLCARSISKLWAHCDKSLILFQNMMYFSCKPNSSKNFSKNACKLTAEFWTENVNKQLEFEMKYD